VILVPVPITVNQTPGAVLSLNSPQSPTSSNVALMVVPFVADGTDNGPMACAQESLSGGGGFAVAYFVAVRDRQHTSTTNTISAFLRTLIIDILSLNQLISWSSHKQS
jgi:hypothetical protein